MGAEVLPDLIPSEVATPNIGSRHFECQHTGEGAMSRPAGGQETRGGGRAQRVDARTNRGRILDVAGRHEFFVRIDMENSAYTDATLEIFETVWNLGQRNVGVVLQSALRRSEDDLRRVNRLGGRIRLVKGAYKEPRQLAYQSKADVDAAFLRLMRELLRDGTYPAIATHDTAKKSVVDSTS